MDIHRVVTDQSTMLHFRLVTTAKLHCILHRPRWYNSQRASQDATIQTGAATGTFNAKRPDRTGCELDYYRPGFGRHQRRKLMLRISLPVLVSIWPIFVLRFIIYSKIERLVFKPSNCKRFTSF